MRSLSADTQTDVMDKSKRNFSSFLSTTQKLLADGACARPPDLQALL